MSPLPLNKENNPDEITNTNNGTLLNLKLLHYERHKWHEFWKIHIPYIKEAFTVQIWIHLICEQTNHIMQL